MKHPLGTLGALFAGALAMYYLDPDLGERRRALLAELVKSGLPGGDRRVRGRLVRRTYHRPSQGDPRSDAELRARVQELLGRTASFPGAIRVDVENGTVRLSGRVLAQERDALLDQVLQTPGLQKLVNAMTSHDRAQQIASRQTEAAPSSAAAVSA
jgi:hypothetical protein